MKNSPDSIILVVTNPIDVLSYAAYKLSGKPSNKVIGSGTVLDSARFRFMISHHCHVDPRNVHAYILGEHGDTEFAVWSKAMIGGVPIDDFCLFCKDKDTCDKEAYFNGIFKEVRDSAYKIIERKHETSYGIGLALVKITEAILKDQNSILPVSNLVNGYLGIKDVYLSLPAVVNKDGIREVLNIGLNKKEENELIFSAEAIKKVIKASGI